MLRQPTPVSYPDLTNILPLIKCKSHITCCIAVKLGLRMLIELFDCSGLLASVCIDDNQPLNGRGEDIAMHGSSKKCHIMLELYTLDKVTLRLCNTYFSLCGNPA